MFLFINSSADYYDSIGPWSQVIDTHENHKNDSYHNYGVYDSLDVGYHDVHVHNI
jgi:hypothetical protein